MNWGNSLLLDWAWPLSGVGNTIDKLVYGASTMFHGLLYYIWRLLAWIVAGIEGIFRNLAGIGSTGKDMTTEIINNSNVQAIFGNLVGLSTAVIVFFTIVKIIQDHYKEKDGGNPYKTVFRTFKGLLMFFFVSAAVSVGLYASQVMFRALDAATGSGTSSIAGQIFKVMAEPANRMALGERDDGLANDTFNEYYKRVADNTATTDGVYFMTEISDDGRATSPSELAAKYLELFPTMQYGVVSSDGARVTPMAQWLSTADLKDHFKDEFSDYNFGMGNSGYKRSNTGVGGSAGFKSDLLQGVELTITPSIDLTWSPVNIDSISYQLVEDGDRVPHPVQIPLWSYTLDIPMSTQFKKFKKSDPVRISLEESAKQFGISMHGGVSLQGGEASTGFSIETFDVSKFNTILFTLATNPIYTNLFDQIMGFIPSFPAQTTIWAAKMDWVRMFAPLIGKAYKAIIDPISEGIIPKTEDGKPTAEIFSDGASGHNAGIWSVMNTKSSTLETTIERYTIDSNFGDIWGTLSNSFDGFINQITEATESAWDDVQSAIDQINDTSDSIAEQQEWQAYMAQVNQYNDNAVPYLNMLGNEIGLYKSVKQLYGQDANGSTNGVNQWLSAKGFPGNYDTLETGIKNWFTMLVRDYNDLCYNKKPTKNFADPRITQPIYKPIVEFALSSEEAGRLSVSGVIEVLTGLMGDITNVCNVNLIIDKEGVLANSYHTSGEVGPAAYRMIDWSAYGSKYKQRMDDIGELFRYRSALDRSTEMLRNDDLADLAFMSLGVGEMQSNGTVKWNEAGGIRNLCELPGDINNYNDWQECTDLTGRFADGYWGTDGIHLDNEAEPIYYRYTGTTYVGNIAAQSQNVVNNHNNGTSPASINTVRPSKAVANSLKTTALTAQNEYIDLLKGKSDDKDEALINKFRNHVITFRKLGTADDAQDDDMRVLDTWCEEKRVTKPNGAHEETMLYNLTPEEIDVMMANSVEARRYLLLTSSAGQNVAKADASNWGSRIGQFSWNDTNTVNALYHYPSMSFVAGYISIIAALGVYMNFAFGLIQRAINMAVLYMMSPITIAFYPFDDGSKFNNGFVKPFYNEAISAFAIIVSLNLFIVLLTPVQKAVTTAIGTGNAFTTTIVGWLALVAFVSMLPQVRSMVQSVLGGSKMGEKSLTDTFKAASGAISAPFKDMKGLHDMRKNAQGKLIKGVEGLHKIGVITKATAKKGMGSITSRFDERLKQRKAAGEDLGFWGERRMAKLEGRDLKAEQQQRIDKARAIMAAGSGEITNEEAFKQAGMSKRDIKRFNKQEKAAKAAAEKIYKNMEDGALGGFSKEKLIRDKQQELLNDPNFKKSVNGVIATKRAKKLEKIRSNDKVQQKAYEKAVEMVPMSDYGEDRDAYQAAVEEKKKEILQKNPFGLKKEVSKLHHAKEWVSKLPANVAEIGKGVAEGIGDTWVGKAGKAIGGGVATAAKATGSFVANTGVGRAVTNVATMPFRAVGGIAKGVGGFIRTAWGQKFGAYGKAFNDKNSLWGMGQRLANKENKEKIIKEEYARRGKKVQEDNKIKNKEFSAMAESVELLDKANQAVEGTAKDLAQGDQSQVAGYMSTINGLTSMGAGNLKDSLVTKNNKRDVEVDRIIDQFKAEFGIENDAEKMKAFGKILKNVTSAEQIINNCVNELGVDQSKVAKATNDFQNIANHNKDIKLHQAAFDNVNFSAQAEKKMVDKIGPEAAAAAKADLVAAWRNKTDVDFNSTNEHSAGYRKQRIIDEYKDKGGISNPECQRRLNEEQGRIDQEFDKAFNDFHNKWGDNIRQYDVAKTGREEVENLSVLSLLNEMQKNRENFFKALGMGSNEMQVILKDETIRKLHEAGNYAGAGDRMMQLADAVRQGNEDMVSKLGFGKDLVKMMKKWKDTGDTKSLQKFYDWGRYDASHMGNGMNPMGGGTMQGAQETLAALTRLGEFKTIMEKIEGYVASAGGEESSARMEINRVSDSIANMFNGMDWATIGIRDTDGNLVKSQEQMNEILKQNLEAVASDASMRNNEWIQANMDALAKYRSDNKGDMHISNIIDRYTQAVDLGVTAEKRSADVNAARTELARYSALIGDTLAKLQAEITKYTGGGK